MVSPVELAAKMLGDMVISDVAIGQRTTYRVGGKAALWVEVNSIEQILFVSEAISESDIEVFVLGKGSNLLVGDDGFDGLVVQLGEGFAECSRSESVITAGAAMLLPVLARRSVSLGLTGLEWAVGVPGSVGGAVRMNAGGHGSDISASLIDVKMIRMGSRAVASLSLEELRFGYRESALESHDLILSARFQLESGNKAASEAELAEIVAWRRENQPGGQNSGSVFRNPPGDSAGRLIEAADLKGLRIGSAEVSSKHANFIQASPGGTAADIAALISEVQKRVMASSGICLHPELQVLGITLDLAPELGAQR